jgi:WD40 repeat protein/beta-lactamase regulating signal transducer with metallopeptidase domain
VRTFVEIGLLNASMAAVLALAALAARRWSRRPALAHALWVLVLLKLLTPPMVPVPILAPEEEPATAVVLPAPPPRLVARATSVTPVMRPGVAGKFTLSKALAQAAETGVLPPPPQTVQEPVTDPADSENIFVFVEDAETPEDVPAVEPVRAPGFSVPTWGFNAAGLFWLAGCAVWFSVTGRRIVRFHRLLRYAEPAPASLQIRAALLARRLGLSRCPVIWLVPGALPPLLWAVGGRARLFFPRTLLQQLGEASRDTLLVHELAHLCRRDHWVRGIEWLALGLYWWNPLVWYGCRALHAVEEECCDAWVVSELPGAAPAYAGALLETVDFLAGARAVLPPAASGFGRMYSLKRRLTMIMHGTTPRGLPLAGRLALLVLAVVLLPMVPARARPEPRSAEEAATTQQDEQNIAKTKDEEPKTIEARSRTLLGGGGEVWSVAISPDGKFLAVGSGGVGSQPGDLHIWDLAKNEEILAVREEKPIRRVAFSPDGKTLATASFDQTVKLRDPRTGSVRLVLRGHTAGVNCVVFTPDGKTVITAGLDNTVRLWDAATGAKRRTLEGHTDWVLSVAVSSDGKRLISGSKDNTAKLWDVATGKELKTLKGHTNWVEGVGIAPDGKTVATASPDMTVKLWDAETGAELRTLTGHTGAVNAAEFSPDGKTLATASHDTTVKLWEVASGDNLAVLEGHTGIIFGLAFSPDGNTLASGSWDKTIKVWDVEARKENATLQARIHRTESLFPLLSIACSPDGKLLALCGEEKSIKLLDAASGSVIRSLEGHTDVVAKVAFSPDGRTLASAGFDHTIKLWDVDTGKERATLRGHTNWVFSVAFSPDGRTLASGSYDKTVRLWDVADAKSLALLKGHRGGVRGVAFSPNGQTLATAGSDRTVKLWDVTTREVLTAFKGHEGAVRCVAFSPDGKTLASGGEDNTVRLWETGARTPLPDGRNSEGKQITSFQMGDMVLAVAFSPRGNMLACAGQDQSIRILDPASAGQRTDLRGHNDAVTCLMFAPDGQSLFSGSADKTVKSWPAARPPIRPNAVAHDHGNQTWVALFAPNGKGLITAGADGTVRVRPVKQVRKDVFLQAPTGNVFGLAFSPDGKILAVGSGDHSIRLFERASGKLLSTLRGHTNWVWGFAFSPDGKKLASAAGGWETRQEPGEVKVWDVATGRELVSCQGHTGAAFGVAWSADGKTLASASWDQTVRLWDAATGKERLRLEGHTKAVRSLAFSPDGKLLASGGFDGTIRLWDADTSKELSVMRTPEAAINAVAFSPDGKTLAVGYNPYSGPDENPLGGSDDKPGGVQLWDVAAGKAKHRLEGLRAKVLALAFSGDGKMLVTGGGTMPSAREKYGEVKVWEVASAKLLDDLPRSRYWVEAVAFSADGRTVAASGGTFGLPSDVNLWDLQSWRNRSGLTLRGHKGTVACAALAPERTGGANSPLLATGGYDKTIRLWDLALGKEVAVLSGHTDVVRCLAFSPDGKTLASASTDKTVRLWDVAAGKEKKVVARFEVGAAGVAFSPDGKLLALCASHDSNASLPGGIMLWDLAADAERTPFAGSKVSALSVAFSPDGKLLASASPSANSVNVWDVASGKRVATVQDSTSVRHLAFSPDGKLLATGHGNGGRRGAGSMQLWDTTTWKEVGFGQAQRSVIVSVAFSPDGRMLATASMDGTAVLWDLSAPRAVAQKDK